MEEDQEGVAHDEKVVSYMDAVEDYKKGKDHQYIVKLISEFFSQKLFSLIHEIFVRKEDKDIEAQEFQDEIDELEYQANGGEDG